MGIRILLTISEHCWDDSVNGVGRMESLVPYSILEKYSSFLECDSTLNKVRRKELKASWYESCKLIQGNNTIRKGQLILLQKRNHQYSAKMQFMCFLIDLMNSLVNFYLLSWLVIG